MFSFIFLQLSSFSKFMFPFDSRRYKLLVTFLKYSLKVLGIFLLSLRVSFLSVRIMLLMALHLSVIKGLTVFQNFLLSVILVMFRFPKNVFLVDFSIFEQIFRSSPPEVFLEKGVLKKCSKFAGEHPCQSVISCTSA